MHFQKLQAPTWAALAAALTLTACDKPKGREKGETTEQESVKKGAKNQREKAERGKAAGSTSPAKANENASEPPKPSEPAEILAAVREILA